MEASLIDERTCRRRETILVSQSIPLPRELRSIELADNDDKKEAETCKHFTIRGYVAGVRKRDAKSCWPFFMLHNHKSDEYADLFPLPVTKFRRWNCENCLRKTDAPAAVVSNGALCQNSEVKGIHTSLPESNIMVYHSDKKILLPAGQQLSEVKIIEGQLIEADSSINESKFECHPSVCPVEKEKEPVIKDLAVEGLQIPKAIHESCEEIQNPPIDKPTVATTGRACTGEKTVVQTTNIMGTAHADGASDMSYVKSKGPGLVHEITDSEVAADPTSMGNNVVVSGLKQHNDVTRHVPVIDSMGLDENDHETSDSDIFLSGYTDQYENHANEGLTSDRKLYPRKARKVRLLDDIIRSEELDVMSKKICMSIGDAEAGQTEVNINRRPGSCHGKDQHLNHKIHLADRKTKVEPSKSKVRYVPLENEDEGPPLMYWLKRVTRKDTTQKGDAEIKRTVTDAAVVNSRPAADVSSEKDLGLIRKCPGTKGKKSKSFVHRKKNEKTWNHLMPQQGIMNGKGLLVAEDAATNNIHVKTIFSESNGVVITGQTLHDGPKIQGSSYKIAIMSKKKRKTPQVEDGGPSQMQLSKDSFGKRGHANIADFQGKNKITKKRRTTRICGRGALDDIPMDIVELLAKNQHERQLMDAKAATETMQTSSEMAKNMNRNGLSGTEDCGNMVLDSMRKDLSQQKILSSNVVSGLGSNWNAECSSNNDKQNSHMDLNKEDAVCASVGLAALPQFRNLPMSCVQPPKSDPKNNDFAESYSWSRERMPNLGSGHTGQAISRQESGRNSLDHSSVLLNGARFRINPQIANAAFNHKNSFYHSSLPQRRLKTIVHETDNLKLVNQDGTPLITNQEPSDERIFSALYPNEVIPAMHLLRLMDSATGSGASLKKSLDKNQTGFVQASDFYSNGQCNELTAAEGPLKTSLAPKHPSASGHPDQGQHYGNSCKPLRPLPRIGVFGSLLQKEIATQSTNYGTQFGLKIGHSRELKSHKTSAKKKSEWPNTASHTRILNAPMPISRSENIKQLSNNFGTLFDPKIRHFNGLNSRDTNGTEKLEFSHTATHTRVLNSQTPVSRNEKTGQLLPVVNSIVLPGCSLARADMVQVNINNKAEAIQPPKILSEMEICVVNWNPADFTIVNEDNEYMIASEDLRPRYINPTGNRKYPNCIAGKKRHKAMKLITPLRANCLSMGKLGKLQVLSRVL